MKWITWLFKMALTAFFFTALSLYATFTALQVYVNKILDHYQLGSGMQNIAFSDFLAELGSGLNIMKQPDSQKKTTRGDVDQTAPVSNPKEGAAETGQTQHEQELQTGSSGSSGSGNSAETHDRTDATPVWSQTHSGSTEDRVSVEQAGKKLIVSTEILQSTKEKITGEDKMKLFSLLVSKLPSDELQTISQLMEDGITQEELTRMDTIIQRYLGKEEYQQLLDILKKYQ